VPGQGGYSKTPGGAGHTRPRPRHANLMTENACVFSSAPLFRGVTEKSVLSAALLAALRCTHVMVDNPDIDVEYR